MGWSGCFELVLCLVLFHNSAGRKGAKDCVHGGILRNVNLEGGIHSNNYTVIKGVSSMKDCVSKCCHTKKCDLAMMKKKKCFSVDCTADDSCRITHTKTPTADEAQIAFITGRSYDDEQKPRSKSKHFHKTQHVDVKLERNFKTELEKDEWEQEEELEEKEKEESEEISSGEEIQDEDEDETDSDEETSKDMESADEIPELDNSDNDKTWSNATTTTYSQFQPYQPGGYGNNSIHDKKYEINTEYYYDSDNESRPKYYSKSNKVVNVTKNNDNNTGYDTKSITTVTHSSSKQDSDFQTNNLWNGNNWLSDYLQKSRERAQNLANGVYIPSMMNYASAKSSTSQTQNRISSNPYPINHINFLKNESVKSHSNNIVAENSVPLQSTIAYQNSYVTNNSQTKGVNDTLNAAPLMFPTGNQYHINVNKPTKDSFVTEIAGELSEGSAINTDDDTEEVGEDADVGISEDGAIVARLEDDDNTTTQYNTSKPAKAAQILPMNNPQISPISIKNTSVINNQIAYSPNLSNSRYSHTSQEKALPKNVGKVANDTSRNIDENRYNTSLSFPQRYAFSNNSAAAGNYASHYDSNYRVENKSSPKPTRNMYVEQIQNELDMEQLDESGDFEDSESGEEDDVKTNSTATTNQSNKVPIYISPYNTVTDSYGTTLWTADTNNPVSNNIVTPVVADSNSHAGNTAAKSATTNNSYANKYYVTGYRKENNSVAKPTSNVFVEEIQKELNSSNTGADDYSKDRENLYMEDGLSNINKINENTDYNSLVGGNYQTYQVDRVASPSQKSTYGSNSYISKNINTTETKNVSTLNPTQDLFIEEIKDEMQSADDEESEEGYDTNLETINPAGAIETEKLNVITSNSTETAVPGNTIYSPTYNAAQYSYGTPNGLAQTYPMWPYSNDRTINSAASYENNYQTRNSGTMPSSKLYSTQTQNKLLNSNPMAAIEDENEQEDDVSTDEEHNNTGSSNTTKENKTIGESLFPKPKIIDVSAISEITNELESDSGDSESADGAQDGNEDEDEHVTKGTLQTIRAGYDTFHNQSINTGPHHRSNTALQSIPKGYDKFYNNTSSNTIMGGKSTLLAIQTGYDSFHNTSTTASRHVAKYTSEPVTSTKTYKEKANTSISQTDDSELDSLSGDNEYDEDKGQFSEQSNVISSHSVPKVRTAKNISIPAHQEPEDDVSLSIYNGQVILPKIYSGPKFYNPTSQLTYEDRVNTSYMKNKTSISAQQKQSPNTKQTKNDKEKEGKKELGDSDNEPKYTDILRKSSNNRSNDLKNESNEADNDANDEEEGIAILPKESGKHTQSTRNITNSTSQAKHNVTSTQNNTSYTQYHAQQIPNPNSVTTWQKTKSTNQRNFQNLYIKPTSRPKQILKPIVPSWPLPERSNTISPTPRYVFQQHYAMSGFGVESASGSAEMASGSAEMASGSVDMTSGSADMPSGSAEPTSGSMDEEFYVSQEEKSIRRSTIPLKRNKKIIKVSQKTIKNPTRNSWDTHKTLSQNEWKIELEPFKNSSKALTSHSNISMHNKKFSNNSKQIHQPSKSSWKAAKMPSKKSLLPMLNRSMEMVSEPFENDFQGNDDVEDNPAEREDTDEGMSFHNSRRAHRLKQFMESTSQIMNEDENEGMSDGPRNEDKSWMPQKQVFGTRALVHRRKRRRHRSRGKSGLFINTGIRANTMLGQMLTSNDLKEESPSENKVGMRQDLTRFATQMALPGQDVSARNRVHKEDKQYNPYPYLPGPMESIQNFGSVWSQNPAYENQDMYPFWEPNQRLFEELNQKGFPMEDESTVNRDRVLKSYETFPNQALRFHDSYDQRQIPSLGDGAIREINNMNHFGPFRPFFGFRNFGAKKNTIKNKRKLVHNARLTKEENVESTGDKKTGLFTPENKKETLTADKKSGLGRLIKDGKNSLISSLDSLKINITSDEDEDKSVDNIEAVINNSSAIPQFSRNNTTAITINSTQIKNPILPLRNNTSKNIAIGVVSDANKKTADGKNTVIWKSPNGTKIKPVTVTDSNKPDKNKSGKSSYLSYKFNMNNKTRSKQLPSSTHAVIAAPQVKIDWQSVGEDIRTQGPVVKTTLNNHHRNVSKHSPKGNESVKVDVPGHPIVHALKQALVNELLSINTKDIFRKAVNNISHAEVEAKPKTASKQHERASKRNPVRSKSYHHFETKQSRIVKDNPYKGAKLLSASHKMKDRKRKNKRRKGKDKKYKEKKHKSNQRNQKAVSYGPPIAGNKATHKKERKKHPNHKTVIKYRNKIHHIKKSLKLKSNPNLPKKKEQKSNKKNVLNAHANVHYQGDAHMPNNQQQDYKHGHPMDGHRYGGVEYQSTHKWANHDFSPQKGHYGMHNETSDNHANTDAFAETVPNNTVQNTNQQKFWENIKQATKPMSVEKEQEITNKIGQLGTLANLLTRKLGYMNSEKNWWMLSTDGNWKSFINYQKKLDGIKQAREELLDRYIHPGDQSCNRGLTVRGATLRGGILSGEFHSMGVVDTQKSCIDLCCKSKRCDVAMTIGRECINIKCFNRKMCTIAPAGNLAVYRDVLPVVTFIRKPSSISKRSSIPGSYTVQDAIRELDENELDQIATFADEVELYI